MGYLLKRYKSSKQTISKKSMDEVNDRFGHFTVTFASLLDEGKAKEKGSHVISPAWRPGGIRNIDVK